MARPDWPVVPLPRQYREFLLPGTEEPVYYKGKLKDASYAGKRLSPAPHYFGVAKAGQAWADPKSDKGDLFVQIVDHRPFTVPVLAKQGDEYIEQIPSNRERNYWRNGVRPIDEANYRMIVSLAPLAPPASRG